MRTRKLITDRFWEHVEKTDDCWNWKDAKTQGYGTFQLGRGLGTVRAHRLSYFLAFGAVEDNLMILHKCDNRRCVRPDHLFAGTHTDNMKDMHNKGRSWQLQRTECPAGHLYDTHNTYTDAEGKRRCKECRRLKRHAKRQEQGYWT